MSNITDELAHLYPDDGTETRRLERNAYVSGRLRSPSEREVMAVCNQLYGLMPDANATNIRQTAARILRAARQAVNE